MTRKKTHEEYVVELSEKNPDVEVVGTYINALTKITHHCLIHDVYWETTPSRVLHGAGCEVCHKDKISSSKYKSNDEYIKQVKNINPNILVIEPYIEARIPILHKCTIHNVEWKAYPDNILKGCGCFECGNQKQRDKKCKSNDEYTSELKIMNKNIIALETYINALTPIKHKCLIDGCEWYASPGNILYGTGCPACKESVGERNVAKWLDDRDIQYQRQKCFDGCKDKKHLPFDFYLPEYNCCIEYDGKQHYEPIDYFGGKESFEYTVKHDNIKNDYCKNNGIILLRIPYFKNVEEELNNFLFI